MTTRPKGLSPRFGDLFDVYVPSPADGDEVRWDGKAKIWKPVSAVPVDRAIHQSAAAVASSGLVQWDPTPMQSHGRSLLDFTDPTVPVVLIAGLYAATVWGQTPIAAGKHWSLDFEVDANGDDPTFEVTQALDDTGFSVTPTVTLGGVWYLPAGSSMFLTVTHDVGGTIGLFRLYLQLIAEG